MKSAPPQVTYAYAYVTNKILKKLKGNNSYKSVHV